MKHTFEIPRSLNHLPVDERGYPVPFFVPILNGKPDFRFVDYEKHKLCFEKDLCGVCGKKLFKRSYWIISGPLGYKNQVSSDPPMHEECARFSLTCCPHLVFEKAQRRTEDDPTSSIVHAKPHKFMLIKAYRYRVVQWPGYDMGGKVREGIFKYSAVYHEEYKYVDNELTLIED